MARRYPEDEHYAAPVLWPYSDRALMVAVKKAIFSRDLTKYVSGAIEIDLEGDVCPEVYMRMHKRITQEGQRFTSEGQVVNYAKATAKTVCASIFRGDGGEDWQITEEQTKAFKKKIEALAELAISPADWIESWDQEDQAVFSSLKPAVKKLFIDRFFYGQILSTNDRTATNDAVRRKFCKSEYVKPMSLDALMEMDQISDDCVVQAEPTDPHHNPYDILMRQRPFHRSEYHSEAIYGPPLPRGKPALVPLCWRNGQRCDGCHPYVPTVSKIKPTIFQSSGFEVGDRGDYGYQQWLNSLGKEINDD